jgi:hypothetical protein
MGDKIMKRLLFLALLLSSLAWGQQINPAYIGQGGMIGTLGNMLVSTQIPIIQQGTTPVTGVATLMTGPMSGGDLHSTATFAPGGIVTLQVNGSLIFYGTMTLPCTWTRTTLANGTIYYTLECLMISTTGQVGVFDAITQTEDHEFHHDIPIVDAVFQTGPAIENNLRSHEVIK